EGLLELANLGMAEAEGPVCVGYCRLVFRVLEELHGSLPALDPLGRLTRKRVRDRQDGVGSSHRRPVAAPLSLGDRATRILLDQRVIGQHVRARQDVVVARGKRRIVKSPDAVALREQERVDFGEAAKRPQRARQSEYEFQTAALPHLDGEALDVLEGLLPGLDGLGMRVPPCGALCEATEVLYGLLRFGRLRIVVRETVVDLVEAAREVRLQRSPGCRVKSAPERRQETGIGDLAGQRVLEDVDGLVGAGPLIEEFLSTQQREIDIAGTGTILNRRQQAR